MSIFSRVFGRGHPEIRGDNEGQMINQDSVSSEFLRLLTNPEDMTKEKALQIPTVRACVDMIAGTITRSPIRLYRKDGKGNVSEVLDDDRVKFLNRDTEDTLTAKMFWRAIIEDYYLGKGAFIYIAKDLDRVTGLYYVKEEDISVEMKSIDPIFKSCTYQVMGKRYFPYEFVRLLRNTHDGYTSKSLIEENSLLMAILYGYLVFELSVVKKGGLRRGFLKAARRISDESKNELRTGFNSLYSNPDAGVIVLNEGIDFKEAASTNQELQLNDNKDICSAEIAKLFGIPYAMLTGSKSRDANAAEDKRRYMASCLALMADIECSLNKDLLREDEKGTYYFAFDARELTKESIKERYEAYEIGLKNNFIQIDEVRDAEDMKPLGIDFVQLALGSVFYNPKTGIVYTPNTNAAMDLTEGAAMNLGDALEGGGQGQNRSSRINLPGGGTKNIGGGGEQNADGNGAES